MFRRRAIRRFRSVCQPALSVATLAGLMIGTVGFPIAPPGQNGAAYPCQGGTCGCGSAAECWTGCCCLTPAQRLAWAKANGVTPPPELERLVAEDEPPAAKTSTAKAVASCCSGHAQHACCDHGKRRSCCSKLSGDRQASGRKATPVAKTATPSSNDTAPTFAPRRCRGLGQWWVAGGQPLALPERSMALVVPSGSEPVQILSARYTLDADSPPTRPG